MLVSPQAVNAILNISSGIRGGGGRRHAVIGNVIKASVDALSITGRKISYEPSRTSSAHTSGITAG